MNLLIKNGRVIDPSQGIDDTLDVLVENGKLESARRDEVMNWINTQR